MDDPKPAPMTVQEAGRRGGLSGGRRRWWKGLTPQERQEHQAKAGRAWWAGLSLQERSEVAQRLVAARKARKVLQTKGNAADPAKGL